MKITRRIDLNLGYSCNQKCTFCYYLDDVEEHNRDKDLSTDEVKRLIKHLYKQGMNVLEFTGGEPTIRKDLPELIKYAKLVGFQKISLITNGIRLASNEYAKIIVDSGIDDFLFSVHGATSKTHDSITRFPGSHKKVSQAIENLLALGVNVRCNSVVSGTNVNEVYDTAQLFKKLGVKTVNFILFNPIEQACKADDSNTVSYTKAAQELSRVIDEIGSVFSKFTIRYMPLCLMPNYENYIQNVHQVHYDFDEWNYYIRSRIREPLFKWFGGLIVGVFLLPNKKYWINQGWYKTKHAAFLEAHTYLNKYRAKECRNCKYRFICGGIWKGYKERVGVSELKAVSGKIIMDVAFFLKKNKWFSGT